MDYNGARPKERKNNVACKKIRNMESQNMETERSTEKDSSGFHRHISVRLYDVLDRVDASAEFRKLRQDCALNREIIGTFYLHLTRSLGSCYIFGSSSEGTTTDGLNSDFDMLTHTDTPVIDDIGDAGDGDSFLMVRGKHTQPGYVKLQCVTNGQPQTVYIRDIQPEKEDSDIEGRIFWKHVSSLGLVKDMDARNGPADTMTDDLVDHVSGYRCSTIPKYAREWIGRDRKYRWPSKRMINKMANMGCFVVGAGHPESQERILEWRLSFSLQERELMFSMNTVQHKCYIMLKMIKKDLIEPYVGKSISSYHLKTCILYVIENTQLSCWKCENLAQCVMVCLYVLLKWVYSGYCPNYFIKEENMFDREIHRQQRFKLLQRMRCVLCNGYGFLFEIKLDMVGDHLRKRASIQQTKVNVRKVRFQTKLNFIQNLVINRNELCSNANTHENASFFINNMLQLVNTTKSVKDHNEQQAQMAFSLVLPFIHLQLAQSYASLAFNNQHTETKLELLRDFDYHLREGRCCDLTSSTLLEATVFYKQEQYERCIEILEHLESLLNQKPLTICTCSYEVIYKSFTNLKQLSPLSVSDILARTSTCMVFLRSDLSITPEALQYEMYRSRKKQKKQKHKRQTGFRDKYACCEMAVVDAVVYLHFLQYLTHAKLNRRIQTHEAIGKLDTVLNRKKHLGHCETGYNLLGWINLQEDMIPRGITYFQTSLSIRPHHNAAKLHMRKLEDKNYQRSQRSFCCCK